MTKIDVPDEIAAEVQRFAEFLLHERADSRGSREVQVVVSSDDISDYPVWDDEDVIALANAGTATARHYRKIMQAIVDEQKADSWVSLDELSAWTGVKRSALSAFRTHLYRYINSHMSPKTKAPFTAMWGTRLRPTRGNVVCYRVSSECAAQWERVGSALIEV